MMPLGVDNIMLPSEEEQQRMFEASRQAQRGGDGRRKWRRGEMEFEALMRQLDNAVITNNLSIPPTDRVLPTAFLKIGRLDL